MGLFDVVEELVEIRSRGVPVNVAEVVFATLGLALRDKLLEPISTLSRFVAIGDGGSANKSLAIARIHVLYVIGGSVGSRHGGLASVVGFVEREDSLGTVGLAARSAPAIKKVHLVTPEHRNVAVGGVQGSRRVAPVVSPTASSRLALLSEKVGKVRIVISKTTFARERGSFAGSRVAAAARAGGRLNLSDQAGGRGSRRRSRAGEKGREVGSSVNLGRGSNDDVLGGDTAVVGLDGRLRNRSSLGYIDSRENGDPVDDILLLLQLVPMSVQAKGGCLFDGGDGTKQGRNLVGVHGEGDFVYTQSTACKALLVIRMKCCFLGSRIGLYSYRVPVDDEGRTVIAQTQPDILRHGR
uniref:Uncharacterized protein n=1 Tax=Photinus pyralis TaxID=7054 RepID=A0A1Y1LUY9_PHOPY